MSITVDQAWVYRFHDMLNLTYQPREHDRPGNGPPGRQRGD